MTLKGLLAIFISLVPLAVLIWSFPSTIQNVPEPTHNRFFPQYSSWHPSFTNFDSQTVDALQGFTYFIVGIAAILAVYWSLFYKPEKQAITIFHSGTHSTPATAFNASIALYCLGTAITGITLAFFDLSKLWSGFAVIHILGEVSTSFILISGGRISSSWFFFIIAAYFNLAMLCILVLEWPYDAIFFRTQGIAFDLAYFFALLHLYNSTRKNYNTGDAESGPSPGVDAKAQKSPLPTTVNHPNQLWLLIIASFLHLSGNFFFLLFPVDGRAFYVFIWAYAIAFPIFAYYVYVETHLHGDRGEKRYYWPETPIWKSIVFLIFCQFLSTLLSRLLLLAIE